MDLKITSERTEDRRIKITAEGAADEWGSQIAYTVWVGGDTDQLGYGVAVGRAVVGAGLELPPLPAAEDPTFALNLSPDVNVPPPVIERDVVVDGDSEAMRALLNKAILGGHNVRMDYTDARGNESSRVIEPLSLNWGGGDSNPARTVSARDAGIVKTFYLYRIDRAEIVS